MKQALAKWYNYSGVIINSSNFLNVESGIEVGLNRHISLPFLDKAVAFMELDGEHYYSEFPLIYTHAVIEEYILTRNGNGYKLIGSQRSFDVKPLSADMLENELNPIPLERRLERDMVMSKYIGKEPYRPSMRF